MNRIIFLLIFVTGGVGLTYYITLMSEKEDPLPVFNPVDIEDEMVDSTLLRKGMGHTIGEFSFYNQNGKVVDNEDVEGKVYVAEYFFTTCGSICPKMNKQLQRIHNKFAKNKEVKLLSFTVDPDKDTVEQMKKYAERFNVEGNQWHFLTGDKESLYQLARTSFFVLKPAEAENQGDAGGDFIHTNNFVLVDRRGRIRGYYDGTSAIEVDKIMRDISRLLKE